MFSEGKNVCKEPIMGSLRVQFLPAGGTGIERAICTPSIKKDRFVFQINGREFSEIIVVLEWQIIIRSFNFNR